MPGIAQLATAFVLSAAAATAAFAQGSAQPEARVPPSVSVSAQTSIDVAPDRARIDLGVVTEAKDAEAAARENARRTDAVLKALRASLGREADIRTVGYSLGPAYEYPREGGRPKLVGYSASNIVRVTTDELGKVGAVIDAATKAGGNRVERVEFILRDPQDAQARALREAATLAKARAETLAAALSLRVVRVLAAEESTPTVYPVREVAFAQARDSASTPIEPGTIEIPATVTLTVEIAPR